MTDCCEEIKWELRQLREELKRNKTDTSSVRSELEKLFKSPAGFALLLPFLGSIQFKNGLTQELLKRGLTNQPPIKQNLTLEREFAKLKADFNKAKPALNQATKNAGILQKLSPLASKAAPLLKIAGIAGTLLQIADQFPKALKSLQWLTTVWSDPDAWRTLLGDKEAGKRLAAKLQALKLSGGAQQLPDSGGSSPQLEAKVDNLNHIAAQANSNASKALIGLNVIEAKVKNLNDIAAQANSNASTALVNTRANETKLVRLNDIAAQANSNASRALIGISSLEIRARQLNDITAQANSNASKALIKANGNESRLNRLNDTAAQANSNASTALIGVDRAIAQSAKALLQKSTPGPKGDKGDRGATGSPGARGPQGLRGLPGLQGLRGLPGLQGLQGLQGLPGLQGSPGRDGRDGKDVDDVTARRIERKLNEINSKVLPVALFTVAVNGINANIKAGSPASEAFKAGVAEGTCRTTQPGGCTRKLTDPIKNQATANGQRLDQINAALNAADLALLKTVDAKLGPQIPNGGIGGKLLEFFNGFKKFTNELWDALGLDKAIQLLNLAASLHNAAMLSRSLGETMVETAESVIRAAQLWIPGFLRNPDGEPMNLDLSELMGEKVKDFLKATLGTDNYNAISKKWTYANRILTTAGNMLDATRSMMNAAVEGISTVGGWIAKMGNGLQNEGLVSDDTWPWMDESPDFNRYGAIGRYVNQLENLDDAASSVQQLANSATEFQQNAIELTKETQNLKKLLDENEVQKKTEEDTKSAASQSPEIDPKDLLPAEDR
jgi:hypothetical protein